MYLMEKDQRKIRFGNLKICTNAYLIYSRHECVLR